MKSIAVLASLAAVSVIGAAAGCSSQSDGPDAIGGSSANGGSSAGGEPSNQEGGRGSGEAGAHATAGEGSAGEPSSGGSDGSGALSSCGTGVLLAGNPLWSDPDNTEPKPNPAGQGLLDDPPIRNEAIAVIGSKLFIETEFEIWSADLSDATPKLVRFAGQEPSDFVNAGVACEDTRFLVIRDMVATAQGKLVVVDYVGGAIIEISDPGGPDCRSDWVAGTHVKSEDPGADYPLAKGDRDGAGAQALFGGPEKDGAGIHKVTVDPDGNIYTWDEGTGKFKMVATDAERTVTTIGVGATDDNVMGLAFLDGKLYATGVDGSNDFLKEVDPAAYDAAEPTKNVKDVFRSRDHFADVPSSNQAITAQVVSDGEALIISGQSGYVWRVATDGTVLATLAGTGAFLDYKDGFDPTKPHPANEWQLVSSLSNSNGGPWLALGNGKLYWSGGLGISKYVLELSCP